MNNKDKSIIGLLLKKLFAILIFAIIFVVISSIEITGYAAINYGCTHDYPGYLYDIVEPTCVQDGISCWFCTNCEQQVGDSWTQPATGHKFDSWEIINQTTCTQDGIKQQICLDCGETEVTVYQSAYGHNYSITYTVDKNSTCISEGEQSYHCLYGCGSRTGIKSMPKAEHSYGSWKTVVEATRESEGVKEHSCENCGHTEISVIEKILSSGYAFEFNMPEFVEIGETFDIVLTYGDLKNISYGTIMITLNFDKIEYVSHEWIFSDIYEQAVNPSYDTNCMYMIFWLNKKHTSDSTEIIRFTFTAVKSGSVEFSADYSADDWSKSQKPLKGTATMYITDNNTESSDVMLGDVNDDGKVNASDARTVLRVSSKLEFLKDDYFIVADVNSDGKINAADARKILRVASKLDTFY